MKTFWLKVIASDAWRIMTMPEGVVPAADGGQMGILADHENMVIAIEVGEAKMQLEDGTWETLAVGTGFLEVVNNRVTMLVQTAEKPEEIDARRAEERREVMEEKLRQKPEYPGILSHKSILGKSHEPVEGVKGEEYENLTSVYIIKYSYRLQNEIYNLPTVAVFLCKWKFKVCVKGKV